jgi:hypothetical protein
MECISTEALLKFYHDNFVMIVKKMITVVDWDEAVEGIYFCPKCGRVGVQKSHSRNHKGCGEVLGLFRKGTSQHHYLKDAFLRMKTMSEFMVYFRETTMTVFDPKNSNPSRITLATQTSVLRYITQQSSSENSGGGSSSSKDCKILVLQFTVSLGRLLL